MSEQPDSFSSLAETFMRRNAQDGQSMRQGEEAGSSFSITYSPVMNFYGNTDKESVIEAERMSQEEFAAYMEEYIRENQRRDFY